MSAPPSPFDDDPRLARVVQAYEGLRPDTLDALEQLFAPGARFIDPFNDVRGRPAIRRVFAHMFETLEQPRFEVLQAMARGDTALLLWEMRFRSGERPRCIQGMSRLRFDAQGLVSLHQDHWDPARQLYEELPLLGALLRWLRRRLSAGPAPH